MSTNTGDNYDASYPQGVDFEEIGVEDEEELSACCGAPRIGETELCSDCREYGF